MNLNRAAGRDLNSVDVRRRQRSNKQRRTLAELAGLGTPVEGAKSNASPTGKPQPEILPGAPVSAEAILGPKKLSRAAETENAISNAISPAVAVPERKSNINDLFAILAYGDRIGNCQLQREALSALRPIIRSAAHVTGFLRYLKNRRALCDGDWETTGYFCLTKEVLKYRKASLYEIDELWKANKFAYIRKALCDDFKDEMRHTRRHPELFLSDAPDDGVAILDAQFHTEPDCADPRTLDSRAERFQDAAKFLPLGPAAISEVLAALMRNPDHLLELMHHPQLSDTAFRSRFAEHVAKNRGVGVQVVRKNLRQFKENSDDPAYARLREILRQNINVPTTRAPRLAALVPREPQPALLPAKVEAQPAFAEEGEVSNAWRPKCPICDARLRNEDDFCSVCMPEDAERKFQRYRSGPSLRFTLPDSRLARRRMPSQTLRHPKAI